MHTLTLQIIQDTTHSTRTCLTVSSCFSSRANNLLNSTSWTFLHKAIITIIMGSLMSAAGVLLFLLRSPEGADPSRLVASACLSIGLMFVVVGLVWIPILKEKHRRKLLTKYMNTKMSWKN
uniref:Phosphoinositide interacting regulator of transient receptor potential channels n=1 Tax=Kryptolebias marmoratus TaxID=37003 RepID=A0A3Q3H277_KRYMA